MRRVEELYSRYEEPSGQVQRSPIRRAKREREIVLTDHPNQHGTLPSRHLHEGDQSHRGRAERATIQIELSIWTWIPWTRIAQSLGGRGISRTRVALAASCLRQRDHPNAIHGSVSTDVPAICSAIVPVRPREVPGRVRDHATPEVEQQLERTGDDPDQPVQNAAKEPERVGERVGPRGGSKRLRAHQTEHPAADHVRRHRHLRLVPGTAAHEEGGRGGGFEERAQGADSPHLPFHVAQEEPLSHQDLLATARETGVETLLGRLEHEDQVKRGRTIPVERLVIIWTRRRGMYFSLSLSFFSLLSSLSFEERNREGNPRSTSPVPLPFFFPISLFPSPAFLESL